LSSWLISSSGAISDEKVFAVGLSSKHSSFRRCAAISSRSAGSACSGLKSSKRGNEDVSSNGFDIKSWLCKQAAGC